MEDNEKNRVEYVARLEMQLEHTLRQLAELKPMAEKWTPIIGGTIEQDSTVRITFGFGGKRITATIAATAFAGNDLTTLTSSIIDTLIESLVADRLREVVEPEVSRLMKGTLKPWETTW